MWYNACVSRIPFAARAGETGMDVRQLEMFRAVAEEGSFTRAAERLHVSQSAISRQVKLLEEELQGRLLHRGRKRATLTAPGELLLQAGPPGAPRHAWTCVARSRRPRACSAATSAWRGA